MGGAKSKNSVEQVSKSFFDIVSSAAQNCSQTVGQQQQVNLSGAKNSIIEDVNITGRQNVQLNLTCYQNTDFNTKLDSDIEQNAKQQADAVVKQYGIGYSQAQNVASAVRDLGVTIKTQAVASCAQSVAQSQIANLSNIQGTVVRNVNITWDQAFTGIANCVQQSKQYTDAKERLQQQIDQTAKASVSGINWTWLLIGLGVIVLIIIIVIIIFFLRSQKTSKEIITNPNTGRNIAQIAQVATPEGAAISAASGVLGGAKA